MYLPKSSVVPGFVLMLMGAMDCLTTIAGIQSATGVELNPVMANLVNTNVPAFFAVKMVATVVMGLIFIGASILLNTSLDRSSRYFSVFDRVLKVACLGLIAFFVVVVVNNLVILLA